MRQNEAVQFGYIHSSPYCPPEEKKERMISTDDSAYGRIVDIRIRNEESKMKHLNFAKAFCRVPFLVFLLAVGCEREDRSKVVEDGSATQAEISFRHKIETLVERLDGKENVFRKTAYGLCCDIREESQLDVRRRLLAVYTNAIKNISVEVSLDSLNDEAGLNGIDVRLRNSWHLAEWGTAVLFDFAPANSEGWDFLIAGVLRWRNALAMTDKKVHQDSVTVQWRKRLSAFKRHLSSMYESKFWGLGKTYWSLRHRMSIKQRQEVRKKVMEALGALPPDMAKDEEK